MIWTSPVSAFSFGVDIGTDATPSMASMSSLRPAITPSGSVLPMMSAVTISGPLMPGPKFSSSRSNATRAGVPAVCWPAFGSETCRPSVGTASAPRAVMTAAIAERVLEVRPPEAVVVRASWERVAECLSMSAPFGAWCERTRSDAVRSHDFVFVSPVWGDCVSPVGVTSLR